MRRSRFVIAGIGLWLVMTTRADAQAGPTAERAERTGTPPPYFELIVRGARPRRESWPVAHQRGLSPYGSLDDPVRPWPILEALAQRFSPILRRLTESHPTDLLAALADPTGKGTIKASQLHRVSLFQRGPNVSSPDDSVAYPLPNSDDDDSRFRDLLKYYAPARGSGAPPGAGDPAPTADTVLFFDFPGSSPESWSDSISGTLPGRIYAHPFVYQHGQLESNRYEFVIQYWFFYPYNDGVNDHEGDWEHLSVSILPRRRRDAVQNFTVDRLLTAEEVREIIDGRLAPEDLVIGAVDYYFHTYVSTVDYIAGARGPVTGPARRDPTRMLERFGWIPADTGRTTWTPSILVRWMLDDGAFVGDSTHPIAYIGGVNRSLLHYFGGRGENKDGHGTYPYPATYSDLGTGAAEHVDGPHPRSQQDFSDERWIRYDSTRIAILPDPERILTVLHHPDSTEARIRWGWLVLPIRYGFPATATAGTTLLGGFDIGQLSPVGPAFSPGWNAVGTSRGFSRYETYENLGTDPSPIMCPRTPCQVLALISSLPPFLILKNAVDAGRKVRGIRPRPDESRSLEAVFGFRPFVLGMNGYARRLPFPANGRIRPALPPTAILDQRFDADYEPDREALDYGAVGLVSRLSTGFSLNGVINSLPAGRLSYSIRDRQKNRLGTVHGSVRGYMIMTGASLDLRLAGPAAVTLIAGYGWNNYRVTTDRVEIVAGGPPTTTRIDHEKSYSRLAPNSVYLGGGLRLTLTPRISFWGGIRSVSTSLAGWMHDVGVGFTGW